MVDYFNAHTPRSGPCHLSARPLRTGSSYRDLGSGHLRVPRRVRTYSDHDLRAVGFHPRDTHAGLGRRESISPLLPTDHWRPGINPVSPIGMTVPVQSVYGVPVDPVRGGDVSDGRPGPVVDR